MITTWLNELAALKKRLPEEKLNVNNNTFKERK